MSKGRENAIISALIS